MIFFPRKLIVLLAIPLLTQCGFKSAPQSQTVTGPFNSRGDYVEDWVDQPDKWYRPPAPGKKSKPNTAVASNNPNVRLADTNSPPKIVRTTPTVVKPKPKPKPKPPAIVRHKVKRGDTLIGLARRYKTTVTKIQKANGLRNTVIRLGQTLKIPR